MTAFFRQSLNGFSHFTVSDQRDIIYGLGNCQGKTKTRCRNSLPTIQQSRRMWITITGRRRQSRSWSPHTRRRYSVYVNNTAQELVQRDRGYDDSNPSLPEDRWHSVGVRVNRQGIRINPRCIGAL